MKTICIRLLALLFMLQAVVTALAATDSRTDFRDETIYFVITTRFYDGDPSNNTY